MMDAMVSAGKLSLIHNRTIKLLISSPWHNHDIDDSGVILAASHLRMEVDLMAVTPADEIIDIEIRIDGAGISAGKIDDLTRQLAAELRELPHESVGIVTDQAQEHTATEATPIATQGAVAMSLRKTILPRVIDLLQSGSVGRARRRFKVKGPNEIELDGTAPVAPEFVDAWLNALTDAKR
jgi:hypothetical protein